MDFVHLEQLRNRLEELHAQMHSKDDANTPDGVCSPTSPVANWQWLGDHPDDAAELAALLHEAAPKLPGLQNYRRYPTTAAFTRSVTELRRAHTLESDLAVLERLKNATPISVGVGKFDWSRLTATISSEVVSYARSRRVSARTSPLPNSGLAASNHSPNTGTPPGERLDVNSGGRVMFCLFESVYQESPAPTPPVSRNVTPERGNMFNAAAHVRKSTDMAAETLVTMASAGSGGQELLGSDKEGCLVIKFVPSRLLCQSEQFASELARHVGICAPDSRILRKRGKTEMEWKAALDAATVISNRHPALLEEMERSECMLIMEFVPGQGLFRSPTVFNIPQGLMTLEDLGRLFTLDMLLGNADRLPCDALGWRGNPENVMCATGGRLQGRIVAIDAVVQRRPPGGLMSAEDAACERLVELALNDPGVAGMVLCEAVSSCEDAFKLAQTDEGVCEFQRGLRKGLESVLKIKGLLEMMHQCIGEWISEFIDDIELSTTITPRTKRASSAGTNGRLTDSNPFSANSNAPITSTPAVTTQKIRAINHEAQRNVDVSEKVAQWKAVFRDRGVELREAVEEWQQKKGFAEPGTSLTTGFLDGTHPVVDMYELRVRLDHMLQRLRVLQQACSTARPTQLLSNVFLSGAVEANSLHLLKHLGVTHILNATEDLLAPDSDRGFCWMRIPLRDTSEEDISEFFPQATSFIEEALVIGGGVLVHCHAGQSRSCSLVLAWLMKSRKWTLRRAVEFLQTHRPQAAPNAGYMAALGRLEEELFGKQTIKVKRTKPLSKVCPECFEKVGLSDQSLQVHLRLKHPELTRAHILQAEIENDKGQNGNSDKGSSSSK